MTAPLNETLAIQFDWGCDRFGSWLMLAGWGAGLG